MPALLLTLLPSLIQAIPTLSADIYALIDDWSQKNPTNPTAQEWLTLRNKPKAYTDALPPDQTNG